MPFLWTVIANQGSLYGNRELNSKVNTANLNATSYAGYNEIFTGKTNFILIKRDRKYNRNKNVLEYLNSRPGFSDKIVVFSSWNVFPFILNETRNDKYINSGSESKKGKVVHARNMTVSKDKKAGTRSEETRYDQTTYRNAIKYIREHDPRIVVIVFGEGDVQAHRKRYDIYLQKANEIDRWTEELWDMLQTDPYYKGKTNLLMCTDHGRGSSNWCEHGLLVKGSSQTWLAMLGPGTNSLKVANKNQVYNKQLASIIANLLGESF